MIKDRMRPTLAVSDFLADLLYFFSGFVPPGKEKKRKLTVAEKLLPARAKNNTTAVILANLILWVGVLAVLVIWVARLS